MSVLLTQGQSFQLQHIDGTSLDRIKVGLGWSEEGLFDIDATLFMLNEDSKVRSDYDFIFYNQLQSACGSIQHCGDNLIGGDEGDDEQISVSLLTIPADVHQLKICLSLFQGEGMDYDFSMVKEVFIRVLDVSGEGPVEVARYDIAKQPTGGSLICAEIRRGQDGWSFRAIGQDLSGGLGPLARHYGVNI